MRTRIMTAVAASSMLMTATAGAQTSIDAALTQLGKEAHLVFQGTVTDIDYANSVEGIPHTFVTYRVEDVLKGGYRASSLTLRFAGGVKYDGGVVQRLSVSHMPRFEMGQQDLLMVKGNTTSMCPLVQCAQGRFRLEQGIVMTEGGDVVAREPGGGVMVVPNPVRQAAPGDVGARDLAQSSDAAPFDRAAFVAHVREVVERQAPAALVTVRSADMSQPFTGPHPAVAAPPRARNMLATSMGAQSEHDRRETEALMRNGGNPVLPAQEAAMLRRARNTANEPALR